VHAAHLNHAVEFDNGDALDEERWRLFALTTAAHTVRTTLTLPVMTNGHVVATVNLYAASQRGFVGHHDELAGVFGAWAAGAVTNADLAFMTRRAAQAAPARLNEQLVIDVVTGHMAAQHAISVETAEAMLRDAASRAGVSVYQLAQETFAAHQAQDPDEHPDRG
jgi:hypothetical protein